MQERVRLQDADTRHIWHLCYIDWLRPKLKRPFGWLCNAHVQRKHLVRALGFTFGTTKGQWQTCDGPEDVVFAAYSPSTISDASTAFCSSTWALRVEKSARSAWRFMSAIWDSKAWPANINFSTSTSCVSPVAFFSCIRNKQPYDCD